MPPAQRSLASGRAGDDDRAAGRRDAGALQRHHREHRGIARGADRHRFARAHAARQPHQPIAFDSRLLRIGAEMGLAKTPAVEDDFVARLPGRV